MAHRVLVIEDEVHILELLKYNLEAAGYKVITSENGKEGLDKAFEGKPDLVILDLMLPDVDGLEICKILKKNDETKNIPIIMLTAKSEEFDKVLGLEIGADDYLAKPFSPRELLARIRAVLRRALHNRETSGGQALVFGPYRLDPNTRELHKGASLIHLTTGEYALLEAFVHRPNRVLSRDRLLDLVRGLERSPFDRSIDLRITRLRRKIEPDPRHPSFIRTVRGAGYLFSPRGGESVR